MTDLKEWLVCNKLCFKLRKNATETSEVLKVAFVERTTGRTLFCERFCYPRGTEFSICVRSISHILTPIMKIVAKLAE
jgi:hypothetical protein